MLQSSPDTPRRIFCALVLPLLLTTCGGIDSDNEDATEPAALEKLKSQIKIKKLWSTSVSAGQGEAFNHLRPVIAGAVIYAAGSEGVVVALDKRRGRQLWKRDVELPLSGAVGHGEGLLLLGSNNGDVLALSAADGSEVWRSRVHGEVIAPPQSNGQVVVVQSYDGKLQGLSAADGSELWVYDSYLPVLTLRGTSTPLLYERTAIAGFGNGKVLAFDIDSGAIRWEARVAIAQGRSEIERIVDIDGNLVLAGSTVYAVSYQGRLAALDVATGRKLWQEDASSYVGVEQGFGNIYVAAANGTVLAYHRDGRGQRWQQPALARRRLSAARAIKGYVAVADFEGYVHFLAQADGSLVGRTRVDSAGVRANMLAQDDILYVYGNSGKLAALQVSGRTRK